MKPGNDIGDIELSPHKYLRHVGRLQVLADGGDVYPVSVELDPVDYCNHRCGWCVDPRHGRTSLEFGLARRLLDEFRELTVEAIVLKGGGEPTLHPRFDELLQLVFERDFEVGLVTNGSRLSQHAGPLASRAAYVRVSVDGPTPAAHRAVHGTDDFDEVTAGVAALVACRGTQRHPVIGLSFAMDHATLGLVDAAVRLGEALAVDYVLFRTPFFEEVGRTPTMTPEQARLVREAFVAAQRNQAGRLRILVDHWISDREAAGITTPPPSSPRRGTWSARGANGIEHLTGRCLASPLLAVVAADGTVYPCCNLRAAPEWQIGQLDYARGVTFRNIWNAPLRQQVMDRLRRTECLALCTHPLSKYNEAIEYLRGPQYHGGFV